MGIDDFKSIKKEVEKSQKYIEVSNIPTLSKTDLTETKTLEEIKREENTGRFIIEIDKLLKEAIILFKRKNIPYDKIQIITETSFYIKVEFAKILKNFYHSKDILGENWSLPLDELDFNTFKSYVPLKFHINFAGSGTENISLEDFFYGEKVPNEFIKIANREVSGVVDLEVFIEKMQKLGFEMELTNYGVCTSTSDYINAIIKNKGETSLSITANIRKKKEIETQYSFKI